MLITVLLLGLQQPRLSIQAQPFNRGVQAAGAAYQQRWRADSSFDGVTLLLSADATLEEAKARLAAVCSASWVAEGGDSLLTRSREQRAELSRSEGERLRAAIASGLKMAGAYDPAKTKYKAERIGPFLDSIDKLFKEDFESSSRGSGNGGDRKVGSLVMGLRDKLPGKAYVLRIAAALGPERLCSLGFGERAVFTSSPNKLQVELPQAQSVLSTYSQDLDAIREGVEVKERGFYSKEGAAMSIPVLHFFSSKEKLAKIAVAAKRWPASLRADEINLSVEALGSGGTTLDSGYLSIPVLPEPESPKLTQSFEIDLLPEETQALQALSAGKVAADAANPAAALISKGQEPFAGLPSALLQRLAKAHHLKLLAILPDTTYAVTQFLQPKPSLTSDEVLKAFASTNSVDIQAADGWLIVKPIYPVTAGNDYVHRGSLRELLQKTKRGSSANVDQVGAFLLANPRITDMHPVAWTLSAFWSGKSLALRPGPGVQWLRLYAAMAPRRGTSLAAGEVNFADLNPSEAAELRRAAFYGRLYSMDMGATYADTEPTEVFVNGIPNGLIKWSSSDNHLLTFNAAGVPSCRMALHEVAMLEKDLNSSTEIDLEWRERIRNRTFDSVQAHLSRHIYMPISFSKSLTYPLNLAIDDNLGPPVASLDQLPQVALDLLKKYRAGGG